MYVPLMAVIDERPARGGPLRADALLAELRALIARHARLDERTAIDGVLLSAAGQPGEPRASTTGTVMAIIAHGSKRLAIGDRVYDYGPGQYLVASVDLPITGHYTHASTDEPALGFGLILRPSAIGSLVLEADADAAPAPRPSRRARPAPVPPGLGVAEASPELLDAVVRMVRLLDSPGDRDILAPMIERRSGHIVFIGSISGRSAYPGGTCYSATKHAVMGFSESLMLELREYGVKVSIVNPGSVATSFSARSDASWMLAAEDVADAVADVLNTPPNVLIHRVEVRTLTVPKKK